MGLFQFRGYLGFDMVLVRQYTSKNKIGIRVKGLYEDWGEYNET